jgi:hypothetical protein
MALDLAKLGQEVLAARVGSLEGHSRFFETLVGSFAVGVLYWALRCPFRTSRAAALAGVIRLEETNIIELHHPMLASTLAIVALGYQWLTEPHCRRPLVRSRCRVV